MSAASGIVDDGAGRTISHEDTVDNLTLFSKEVLPNWRNWVNV